MYEIEPFDYRVGHENKFAVLLLFFINTSVFIPLIYLASNFSAKLTLIFVLALIYVYLIYVYLKKWKRKKAKTTIDILEDIYR
jgi:hypothetical protein